MATKSPPKCNVNMYFKFCAFTRSLLLLPGLAMNTLILVTTVNCQKKSKSSIKKNVMVYIIGSTICNISSLLSWPLLIDWRLHYKWRFSSSVCELIVHMKQIANTLSFYYVSCITFSIYLTIVYGQKIVEKNAFIVFQVLFPCMVLFAEELVEHFWDGKIPHYNSVNQTCFTIIDDKSMKVKLLMKLIVFLPLTLYFYLHILYTTVRSAQAMQRSQTTNKKLAVTFLSIFLITCIAHTPGAILTLMQDQDICFETMAEFLFELPVLFNPIILFCINKELRSQCQYILCRKSSISFENQQFCMMLSSKENHDVKECMNSQHWRLSDITETYSSGSLK